MSTRFNPSSVTFGTMFSSGGSLLKSTDTSTSHTMAAVALASPTANATAAIVCDVSRRIGIADCLGADQQQAFLPLLPFCLTHDERIDIDDEAIRFDVKLFEFLDRDL